MSEKDYDVFISRYYSHLYSMIDGKKNIVLPSYGNTVGECFLYHVIERIGFINEQKVYVDPYSFGTKIKLLWNKKIRKDNLFNKKIKDFVVINETNVVESLIDTYPEYTWANIRIIQINILKEFYNIERE